MTAFSSPAIALGAVGTDAIFACPALTIDQSISQFVPTFAYEFNDDAAPPRYAPTDPPVSVGESVTVWAVFVHVLPMDAVLSVVVGAVESLVKVSVDDVVVFPAESAPVTASVGALLAPAVQLNVFET